jgi:hypothetical protein
LKRSKFASVPIFDAALKREAIDESNNSSRVTEVAYEFVSTDGQSLSAQIVELKAAKCEKIFQEKN